MTSFQDFQLTQYFANDVAFLPLHLWPGISQSHNRSSILPLPAIEPGYSAADAEVCGSCPVCNKERILLKIKEMFFRVSVLKRSFTSLSKKNKTSNARGGITQNYADIFRTLQGDRYFKKKLRQPTPLKWKAHGEKNVFGCCRGLIRQSIQSKLLNHDNYENFISIISPITSSAKSELRKEII